MADDEQVVLEMTSDPHEVGAQLDRRLQVDPVRATILGTIRIALGWDHVECWCAATPDGRAVAVRSNPRYPVVLDGQWQASEVTELADFLARLPYLAGITGGVGSVRSVAACLPLITPKRMMSTRLYRLDTLTAPTGVSGEARRASVADRDLVYEWYEAFGREAGGSWVDPGPDVDRALSSTGCWLWDDGGTAVSLATRRPVVAGSARVGPVYTPTQWRRRSYGSAVTAAASQDILDDGGVPVLFADLANPTSNDIYQRLGYYPVEDRLQIEFA